MSSRITLKIRQNDALKLQQEHAYDISCYCSIVDCFAKYGCNIVEQVSQEELNKLLHIAVKKKHQGAVKVLVKYGADVHFQDEFGNTALSLSEQYSESDQIYDTLVLTEVNANFTYENEKCFYHQKIKIIIQLLQSFYSYYFLAALEPIINPVEMVLLLVNNYTKIKDFYTNVYEIIKKGYNEFVDIILNYGVDVNIRDKFGRPMLNCACNQGNKSAVQFLLKRGANINEADIYQQSPLHHAINAEEDEIVKLLIAKGANVNICNTRARYRNRLINILYTVLLNRKDKSLDVIKMLIEAGLDINDNEHPCYSLLYFAIDKKCLKIVEYLLEKGADVNKKNLDGRNSINLLVHNMESEQNDFAKYKVNLYNKVYAPCTEDEKWFEGMHKEEKMVAILLKHGADINIPDNDGQTALTRHGNIGSITSILFIKCLAQSKFKSENVYEENLNCIYRSDEAKTFFFKCMEELTLMKNIIISDDYSLYNFLYETNINKLVIYVNNDIVKKSINPEDGKIVFPIYRQELNFPFSIGKKRRLLLDLATANLNNHFQFPYPVIEKIVLLLNHKDLINLSKI